MSSAEGLRQINRNQLLYFLVAVFYAVALFFFYGKYVPLVKPFQAVLLPVLVAVFALTAIRVQLGTLSFIFFFPLINNLPYFFGIFERVPHAPTALVLFLFYFLGWLTNRAFVNAQAAADLPVFKPIRLFSILLSISLLITFFRYANAFPFSGHPIYELVCNVNGVTTGGALMSALFGFLNYMSGFLFLLILLDVNGSKLFARKILVTLFVSTFLSLSFGFYQLFRDKGLGNTPLRESHRTINATFKDPLSFGAFLAVMIPLTIGVFLTLKKWKKGIPAVLFIAAIFILPRTGSLSGLFAALLSVAFLALLSMRIVISPKSSASQKLKKWILALGLTLGLIGITASILYVSKSSISFKKLSAKIRLTEKTKNLDIFSSARYSYFWAMAGRMIKDYPTSGVGIGSYIIELPNYAQLHNHKLRVSDSAENYFLQVGSELGVLGLFCILWIFWEILKQMRLTLKDNLKEPGWDFLVAGLCAAIISIFAIFFVHSFIGSYEIMYTFWLLVGLIFCLSPSSDKTKENAHPGKTPRVLAFVIIVAFASSLAWNSTHSLSLRSRTELLGLKQDFGLYQLEKTDDGREFRWTREYGGLTLRIEKPVIEIPLLASHPDIRTKPVKVECYLIKAFFRQKKLLGELTLDWSLWKNYRYDVSAEVGQEVILLLKVSRTWNPLKTIGTPDPRNLGVAIGKVEFEDNNRQ